MINMKLIKINTDHYVVVDDSEIKEGDWFLPISGIGWELNKPRQAYSSGGYTNGHCRKITHSTQPLESIVTENSFKSYEFIPLQEVKELIGEVDVEKKAEIIAKSLHDKSKHDDWSIYDQLVYEDKELIKLGYNQALEDNKEKKYTEEDIANAITFGWNLSHYHRHNTEEKLLKMQKDYIQSLQPKTEWEVEIVDGKLKLK